MLSCRHSTKRAWAIAATAVVALLLGAVLAWAARSESDPAFDKALFRRAVASRDYDRVEQQAKAAMREGLLEGKTKRQVRSVLGLPDSGSKTGWSWHVGPVNGFMGPADDGWVSLVFDERTGRVTELTAP